jgi:hypothetical protein
MAIPENLYGADGLKTGFDGVISTMQLASWAESQRARVDEKRPKSRARSLWGELSRALGHRTRHR